VYVWSPAHTASLPHSSTTRSFNLVHMTSVMQSKEREYCTSCSNYHGHVVGII